MHPWTTMECSQLGAWKMNRSLIMASHGKVFTGKMTNASSTLPRAAHLEGDVIECHQCLHLALWKCSSISRHVTNPPSFVPNAYKSPPPSSPHTIHHSCDQMLQLRLTRPPSTHNHSASEYHPHTSVVTQQQQP